MAKVPGEESIVLTSPNGALVRIAATELNPTASVRAQDLEGGIDLGDPCHPSPAPIIAERHCMLGRARRSHLCTIELRRS